jgi:hypothetical protein
MTLLNGSTWIASMLSARVSAALDEMNAGHRWQPPQRTHAEALRPVDQTVDRELVTRRVDCRHA